MDKPKQGINPVPAGTQNGSRPKTKKVDPGMKNNVGNSLPKRSTKVTPPGGAVS